MDIFVLTLIAFLVQIATNIIILVKIVPLISKAKKNKVVEAKQLFDDVNKLDLNTILNSMVNKDEHI